MENSSTQQGCKSTEQDDKNPGKNDNSCGGTSSPVNVDHQEEGESMAVMTTNEISSNNQSNGSRTPFTHLSQVDADLALARTLQEQERAYMMLRMNGGDGSDYGSWEGGSYVHEDDDEFDDDPSEEEFDGSDADEDDDDEEDAFDVHAHAESENDDDNPRVELDSTAFPSDEAYARALQDAEDQEMAARILALADMVAEEVDDSEDHGANSQDTWEDVDPDELSYEELIALGEVVGTESRGLSADSIASLPSINYKAPNIQEGSSDTCVICRLDYEDGDTLTVLSCKHSCHPECITNWLQINKVCPVCSAEVSTSENS